MALLLLIRAVFEILFWSFHWEAQLSVHSWLQNHVPGAGKAHSQIIFCWCHTCWRTQPWKRLSWFSVNMGVACHTQMVSTCSPLTWLFNKESLLHALNVEFEQVWKLALQIRPWFVLLFLLLTILGMESEPRRRQLLNSHCYFRSKVLIPKSFHDLNGKFKEQWEKNKVKRGTFKHYQFEISWLLKLLYREAMSLSKQC